MHYERAKLRGDYFKMIRYHLDRDDKDSAIADAGEMVKRWRKATPEEKEGKYNLIFVHDVVEVPDEVTHEPLRKLLRSQQYVPQIHRGPPRTEGTLLNLRQLFQHYQKEVHDRLNPLYREVLDHFMKVQPSMLPRQLQLIEDFFSATQDPYFARALMQAYENNGDFSNARDWAERIGDEERVQLYSDILKVEETSKN